MDREKQHNFRIVDIHIAEAGDFIKKELKKNKLIKEVIFLYNFF